MPSDSLTEVEFKPRWMLLAAVLCSLLMLPVAWAARTWVSPDGIAYLEMADQGAHISPLFLFTNGYWSPAYPTLLAIAMKAAHPGVRSELAIAHAVDWLIYTGACCCFLYFIRNLMRWMHLPRAFLVFACALFFVSNLDSSLWTVSPDVLLEGLVYLAAGICIRLGLPDVAWRHYALLGMALAAAYSAKAILFPLSMVLLLILFIRPVSGRKGIAVAAAAFLLAASPFVAILSYSAGHLTFGDSGRVNYARHVNGVNFFGLWAGAFPDAGAPVHPATKLSAEPLIVKFEGAYAGTWWPFWYDQSYWYGGVHPRFSVNQQAQAYLVSLGLDHRTQHEGVTLFALARRWIPLYAGLAVLVLLGMRFRSAYAAVKAHIWLLLWPACAVLVYAGVVLHYRYLVSFAVIGWIGAFAAASVARPAKARLVLLAMACALLVIDGRTFLSPLARLVHTRSGSESDAWSAAGKVRQMGIAPGDRLAMVGFPFRTYFARLAGAQFTQIIGADPAVLSKLPEAEVRRIEDILRTNGAKALVSLDAPAFVHDSGWVNAGEDIYIRLL